MPATGRTDPLTPLDQIRRLSALLAGGERLPEDLRAWLAGGIGAFLDSGGHTPLCVALGIRKPGCNSIAYELARAKRDAWLRTAFEVLRPEHPSCWSTVCRLALVVQRFEAGSYRRLAAPGHSWPAYKVALWHAFATGLNVPRSPRQLYTIVIS